MTTLNIQQTLNQVLDLLDGFTADSDFLRKISLAFGEEKAAIISSDGLQSALNTLPAIDIRSSEELNGALGAFSASTATIYLSEDILSDQGLVVQVLLEEIGHYLDNYFGDGDTVGDEGELFSAVVRGVDLSESELIRIQTENDATVINLGKQLIEIEQATPIILTVTTTADQNDGSATNGLSLRDAILIANANTANTYIIELQGGQTYILNQVNSSPLVLGDENAAKTGDLDVLAGANITLKSVGNGQAIINAYQLGSKIRTGDRAFHVLAGGNLTLESITVTKARIGGIWIEQNGVATIDNSNITGNTAEFF